MKNPWLSIPANDYEGHMASPSVCQLQALNQLFCSIYNEYLPSTIAMFGCCTGNGFEHIESTVTNRVVGVDINPYYLSIAKDRYADKIPHLELIEQDISADSFSISPVSLIFAALLFEYVNIDNALKNVAKSLLPDTIFVAALQMPSTHCTQITPTPYKSLESLETIMKLVDKNNFIEKCKEHGLRQIREGEIQLKLGKQFYVGYYKKTVL